MQIHLTKPWEAPEIRGLFKRRFPLAQIQRLQPRLSSLYLSEHLIGALMTGYINVFLGRSAKRHAYLPTKTPMSIQV